MRPALPFFTGGQEITSKFSARDEYFEAMRQETAAFYLSDPSNPYRQSGRTSGAARWEETRRCIVDAIHRDGDFMDVGCANGLLLETVIDWARERGFILRPHGLDFVPELVELARERFPGDHANFNISNAFYWRPPQQYDFVRTNIEHVPAADYVEFVRNQYEWVARGGRLIVCHYRNSNEPYVDLNLIIEHAGLSVAAGMDVSGTAVRWVDHGGLRS